MWLAVLGQRGSFIQDGDNKNYFKHNYKFDHKLQDSTKNIGTIIFGIARAARQK